MKETSVVIVGAGQAGFQLCASLREKGYDGRIDLIGDERTPPYERPPLSKDFLAGSSKREDLLFRSEQFYRDNDISLLLGESAVDIDRFSRRVRFESGRSVAYDHLVLAQGARNRTLPLPGDWALDAMSLRTIEDAERLKEQSLRKQKVVVIGAGFVGLEVAATLARSGIAVEILDVMPRVMSRSISAPISEFFQKAHAGWGSTIRCSCAVNRIERISGNRFLITTSDDVQIENELIVVGIGVIPNAELAFAAELMVDNGIVVDDRLRTADERIFAIGDCANFPSAGGAAVRIESVQNAVDQARCVAAQLTGSSESYSSVPWFWSEQNGLKLQIVGVTKGHTHVALRGNPEQGQFSVFCFNGSRLLGIESVNRPTDHIIGRRLIGKHVRITPQQVSDVNFDLKRHLERHTAVHTSVA
jgi:3-phenylpropionate/trans-cinnamate dioxygenase ferredoxin reductase subunit